MHKLVFAAPLVCLTLAGQSSVLNLSHDLVSKGIAASNLQPNNPAQDARPLVEAAVAYAGSNGIATLIADPGAYYFLSQHNANTHVLLNSASSLTVDWQGSDLYFKFSNVSAFQVNNSSGVTLQNFTVDYQTLPFTQVTVTSVNSAAQTISFQTIPGYQSPSDFNTDRAPDASDAIFMWIFRNGIPISDTGRLSGKRPVTGSVIAISDVNDPWAKPAQLAAIQPGDTLVLTDRSGPPSINFVGGQDGAVRNASVYSSGQIGVYFGRTNRATADHVQIIPRPGTTRLISTNADGIHTSFALGANVFTNNIVRRTCDDALAISAAWTATVTDSAGTSVTVARNLSSPFPVGAPVSFINPATDAVIGPANIVSETPSFAQQKFTDGETITLTLDHSITALASGFGMVDGDPSKLGSGSVIAYNTVQEGIFSRGIWLAGVEGVSVHDNYIQRASSNGIFIQQLSGNNTDAGPSSNITIQNNVVESALAYSNVSHGPTFAAASIYAVSQNSTNAQVTTSPHTNITISGNRVTESARSAIRLENVSGSQISGNAIQGFGLAPTLNVYNAPSCCESLTQYEADFMQAILTPSSVSTTTSANTTSTTSNLNVNSSTASGYPRLGVGSFAAAYGTNLAPSTVVATTPYPTSLGGITVSVQDSTGATRLAPINLVSATQVNYIVPEGTAPGIGIVTISSTTGGAQIDTVAPGLYSANHDGQGVAAATAAIYSAGGSITPEDVFQCASTCSASPLDLGAATDRLIVTLYGTGLRNISALSNARATVGAMPAALLYVGAQPQYPGLDQVNLEIPRSLAGAGEVPVVLTVDGQTANVVTVSLK
jgi:uncharacterized protein (TIGR03437 family)